MKKVGPPKNMHYFNIGPWPGYVGFTTSQKAFAKEMKRLKIEDPSDFVVGPRANATTHFLNNHGKTCVIICMPSFDDGGCSREQYAALVAHEAMHVIQAMQDELAAGKTLGSEAEAYLIQQIVQESLQIAWNTGMITRREPV